MSCCCLRELSEISKPDRLVLKPNTNKGMEATEEAYVPSRTSKVCGFIIVESRIDALKAGGAM